MDQLTEQMKAVLCTAFSFYLKAHYYHWNVTGPGFYEYHKFFGDVYEQVHDSLDAYGEHIRVLGSWAPGSIMRINELTRIQDDITIPASLDMLMRLESDNQIMLRELAVAAEYADALGQRGVLNFVEERIDAHEKIGWMLKSFYKSS